MVTGVKTSSLKFDAYERDPLARLVLGTLNWKSWELPALYTTAWIVILGLTILVYVLRDGSFDVSRFGGYPAFIPTVAVDITVFFGASWLYLYFSRRSGTLYEDLADQGVINRSECRNLVQTGEKSIKALHVSVLWLVGASILVVILSGVWYYQYSLDPGRSDMVKYQSTLWLIYLPHLAFGACMVGMMIARIVSTVVGLRRVFDTTSVSVQPLHPDRCGGLRHLRNYALAISNLMALFGVMFAVLIYSASRVWVDGTIITNATEILGMPIFWAVTALYVTVTPALFFGVLWTGHGPMQKEKSAMLSQLSQAFDKQHKTIMGTLDDDASRLEPQFKHLDYVGQLYRKTSAFPVWPLDIGSLTRFGAVFGSPILISAATILVQAYLFK